MSDETILGLICGVQSAILVTIGLWFLDRWLITRDDADAAMDEAVALTQPTEADWCASLAKAEADREMGRLDEVRETWST